MTFSLYCFMTIWLLFALDVCDCETRYLSFLKAITISKRNADFKCKLPPHPRNGQWMVIEGPGPSGNAVFQRRQPGEEINQNTILEYKCHSGYKLSSPTKYIICDTSWNQAELPTCLKLCPPLSSTATTILKCTDINRREISCSNAAHGTYLSYDCIAYYEAPLGYRKTLTCIDGQWRYNTPVCQPVCGRKVSDAKTFSVGGQKLPDIEYPWIAAVYQRDGCDFTNVCGGSIISRKVVLTAAHCVTNAYGNKYPAENFRIGVGKLYNKYEDTRDKHASYYEVREIIPYPSYNGESRRYVGDVAIVVTKQLFKWGPLVQPVCIININRIPLSVGSTGEIAGWGVKEDGEPSDELRFLRIPYKNERECASELPSEWEAKYNFEDKMCAGFHNKNISVCRGDSGSGLVFRNPEDSRYYIHGIVSLGPSLKGECNIRQNTLYTRVAYYSEFIDRQTNKYYEEQCILPSYPANGKYVVDNDENKLPGDIVSTSSVLKVQCNKGYTLVPAVSTVECENVAYMPRCQLICPLPKLPNVASYECVNHETEFVNCSRAVTGTILKFTCSRGYAVISGSSNLRSCRNGSWGTPNPGCSAAAIEPIIPEITSQIPLDSDGVKVICTYASWASYKNVNPDSFDASLCTHVYYAFAGIWDSGDMRVNDDNLDVNQGLFRNVTEMKKRNPNLKVLLSVGGSKSTNGSLWSNLAASHPRIEAFIGSSSYFVRTYDFDGINIDWHYPQEEEKENYVRLLKKLREAYDKEGWLFTASARSDFEGTGYDVAQMNEILDWVTVKTYDFYGHWSSYTGEHTALYASSKEYDWEKQHLNIDAVVKNWVNAGLNKTKLVISVAFYARTFKLKDEKVNGIHAPIVAAGVGDGILEYSEICTKYANWSSVWNDEQKSTYKYKRNEWFSYDTKDAMWIKGTYVKEQGLAGVNVWSIDSDDVSGKCGTKQILLKHLHGGMGHSVDLK